MLERRKEAKHKLHLGSTHNTFLRLQVLRMCFHASSTPIDASQTNAEMQPQNLSIQLSPPHSASQNSSNVFMIDNIKISNSLSLKLMGEPTISIDTHHFEKNDLLEYQSFISYMVVDTVL